MNPPSSPAPRAAAWFLLVALAAGFGPVAAEPSKFALQHDWPTFRGAPQLTGMARERLSGDLEVRWVFEAEDGFESAATIVSETVFASSLDGNLYALELATGKVRWTYKARDEIRSSPSFHDGTVFFGDGSGAFHAVDAATGKLRWLFEADAEIVSSANFEADRVLFGSHDQFLYCLARSDGALRWKAETEGYVYGTPAIVDGNVISAGCDGRMRVLRVRDGAAVHTIELGAYVGASPVLDGNRVYVGTFGNQIVGVDLSPGVVGPDRLAAVDRDGAEPFVPAAHDEQAVLQGA